MTRRVDIFPAIPSVQVCLCAEFTPLLVFSPTIGNGASGSEVTHPRYVIVSEVCHPERALCSEGTQPRCVSVFIVKY